MAYMNAQTAFREDATLFRGVGEAIPVTADLGLSALEWQVVRLAERDLHASLRPPTRFARLIAMLFGFRAGLPLTNERLEALRRIAVLSWRRGDRVHSDEVRAFLSAGFSADQYELVVDHISAVNGAPQPEIRPMNMQTPISTDDGAALPLVPDAPHPRRVTYGIVAVLGIALAGTAWLFLDRSAPAAAAPPPPTLTVATPPMRDVEEWDDYVGRFEPSQSVEVRPRVSGQVTAVHFTDGSFVARGQVLFTIDPRPFTAALAEAQARLASARSDVALAQANLARAQRLIVDDAVSKSDLDTLAGRVRASTAAVAAAEAQVRARSLDVTFTQVRAPIAGKISDRRVDAGNMVSAADAGAGTLLTSINALDPIYFSFNGSEALFLKTRRAQEAKGGASAVEIRLQDENAYNWKGQLDFTDNGLDARSGTIRARAVVANPSRFLTPGMFGNMRLRTGGRSSALLVPDSAIATDQARKTILTVGNDGIVTVKPVILGPVVDGLRVIRSGLGRKDRVVIAGVQLARPGDKVLTQAAQVAPAATQATASAVQPLAGEATFSR